MVAFTVLYCILFFYIGKKVKTFQTTTSTAKPSINEQCPMTDLEAASSPSEKPLPALPPILDLASPATVFTHRMEEDQTQGRMKEDALKLLLYPILFTCLAMPLVIARLAELAGDDWSFLAMDIGACFYCSLGWVNVIVYVAARKGFISGDWLLRKHKSKVLPV